MGDDRPPVYWEDETLIIRASAIGGSCLWELIAHGQDYPASSYPPNILRAFSEGNTLEPVVIKKLEDEYGFVFLEKQVEGELILGDNVAVRYHPDGIVDMSSAVWEEPTATIGNDVWVVEVKALSNDVYQKAVKYGVASTFDEYPWQLSVMMIGQQMPGVWAVYNKGYPPDEHGVKKECEDQGKIYLEPHVIPPISLEVIRARAEAIRQGVMGEDILEAGRKCDDPDHWPCLFLHLRPEVEEKVSINSSIDPDDFHEIDQLAREYAFNKGQYDENEMRYQTARDKLVELAGGRTRLVTDKYQVNIIENKGRDVYDWEAMPRELKEQLEQYKKPGKGFKYIRVKGLE